VEGQQAVIKLDDGNEVLWPVKNLEAELTTGSKLNITIATGAEETTDKEAMARTLLNDVLNVKSSSEP